MKTIALLSLLCLAIPCQAITYSTWIASYGLTGDSAAIESDPDGDGIQNLMEYALDGMSPIVTTSQSHASMPKFGFVRRTGAALGAWEWVGATAAPTNGLGGKWHFAMRFIARPGVENIRYLPQVTPDLTRWHGGRGAVYTELYPGNIIQATARGQGNRFTRHFLRLKVIVDADAGDSLSGIKTASFAAQALVPGTPASLARAVTAPSTSSVQVEDRLLLRTTGADTVTDYTWAWTPAPTNINPVELTRETSNAAVIIADATDPYRWTYTGTGTATIRLRTASSTYQASITTSTATGATTDVITGYATGSLRDHINDAIDPELAARTPSMALPIYTTQDHTTPAYTRNAGNWAGSYVSALTAISPWNSDGGAQKAGILISPRHVLFATHWAPASGSTIRFIAADNTVVTRTISAMQYLTQSQGYYPDLAVGRLDSDVPGTISFARVLPSGWETKLPSLATAPVVCACTDQEEKLLIREVTAIPSSTSPFALVTFRMPADATRRGYYEDVVSGDSSNPAFLLINNQLVVLTCWTFGGSGSGSSVVAFKSAINTAMTTLGGGYTCMDADLSSFTSY